MGKQKLIFEINENLLKITEQCRDVDDFFLYLHHFATQNSFKKKVAAVSFIDQASTLKNSTSIWLCLTFEWLSKVVMPRSGHLPIRLLSLMFLLLFFFGMPILLVFHFLPPLNVSCIKRHVISQATKVQRNGNFTQFVCCKVCSVYAIRFYFSLKANVLKLKWLEDAMLDAEQPQIVLFFSTLKKLFLLS